MKGKKKYILPLLLAGVTATGVVTNVQQSQNFVSAEEVSVSVSGSQITLEGGFEDSYQINDPVYLPKVKLDGVAVDDDTTKVKYAVKKGGLDVDVLYDTDKDQFYFKAEYEGYYNISLKDMQTDKVVSDVENMSIWVEKADAVINLPVNSNYVIPAKIPVSQKGFKIPAPSVTIGDDEKATDARTLGEDSLRVTVITPSKIVGPLKLIETTDKNDYYEVSDLDLATAGTYQIVYEYVELAEDENEEDIVISRLESNFQVVNNYTTSGIKLNMEILDSLPTSGNVGTAISIPKVKVTESASSLDAINARIDVVVTEINTNTTFAVDYKDYTFTPTIIGDYMVTYRASIPLFGLSTAERSPDTTISIKDKKSPVVRPTFAYETNTNGEIIKVDGKDVAVNGDLKWSTVWAQDEDAKTWAENWEKAADEMLENRADYIPSVAQLDSNGSVKVKIPAIYATDNYDKLGDIKLERTYRFPNGTVKAIDGEGTDYKNNEIAEVEFKSTGTYEIRYRATDKAGNTLGNVEYDITIYAAQTKADDITTNPLHDGETEFNFNISAKTVSDKEKTLTFNKPSVKDTYDAEVDVKTFVMVKTGTDTWSKAEELTEDNVNANGKYELDIKKYAAIEDIKGIKIYAEAYLDYTLKDTREDFKTEKVTLASDGSIIVKSTEYFVSIVPSNDDDKAASFAIVGADNSLSDAINWNNQLFELNKTTTDEDGDPIGITIKDAVSIDDEGYAVKGANGTGNRVQYEYTDNEGTTQYTDLAAFDQGNDIIYLPTVTFTDEFDENMVISLTIKDKFGNEVSKVKSENIKVTPDKDPLDEDKIISYTYTISGASFKLSNSGMYTVTYKARDVGGNITIKTYGINVNNKTNPTIKIEDDDKFGKDIEIGEKFIVPEAKLLRDGEVIKGGRTEWTVQWSSGAEAETYGDTGFIPLKKGTYTIVYTGYDEYGNEAELESSIYTVNAVDSTKPVLQLNNKYHMVQNIEWEEDEDKNYMTINIPVAFAHDGQGEYGKEVDVVYTVTGPSSKDCKVSDHETLKHIKTFQATKEGIYTVKYEATDEAGNVSTITKTLYVGDCDKPTMTWEDQEKNLPTTVALNEEFELDLSKIILDDGNGTSKEDLQKNLTVTLTGGASNKTITNKGTDNVNYIWELTETGSYTLKFVVKDNVGNSNTYTYEINVPAEEAEDNKISPVLGTVLVVLSVVVLSGVVIYFVASSKKGNAKTTRKSKKS